jgi:YD repeat-containing protein
MEDAYSVNTGSIVNGLVPGLTNHMGGATVMFVNYNPSGKLTAPEAPATNPSGNTIAYDYTAFNYYQLDTGSTWYKIGSIGSFAP